MADKKLEREVRERLRRVCSHMDEATFEELVKKVVAGYDRSVRRPLSSLKVDAAKPLPRH